MTGKKLSSTFPCDTLTSVTSIPIKNTKNWGETVGDCVFFYLPQNANRLLGRRGGIHCLLGTNRHVWICILALPPQWPCK